MKICRYVFVSTGVLAGLLAVASAQESKEPARQPHVAALPMEAGPGVDKSATGPLTTTLVNEIGKTGAFTLVSRDEIDSVLKEQEVQLSDCTASSCKVQIGQLIGAEKIITSKLEKLGKKYIVSASLIDVETAKIDRSDQVECACPLEDLSGIMAELAAKLAGATRGPVSSVAVMIEQMRLGALPALPELKDERVPVIEGGKIEAFSGGGVVSLEADIEALEAYDAAGKADRNASLSSSRKKEAWEKVVAIQGRNPYREMAKKRAAEWIEYSKAETIRRIVELDARYRPLMQRGERAAKIDEIRGKAEEDMAKIERVWPLEIVTAAQKRDLALAFVERYGEYLSTSQARRAEAKADNAARAKLVASTARRAALEKELIETAKQRSEMLKIKREARELSEGLSEDDDRKLDQFLPDRYLFSTVPGEEVPGADANLHPLQKYDITQLKLTGIIWGMANNVALIKDPTGKSYNVKVGTPIGKNQGKVIEVQKDQVLILEHYFDYKGAKINNQVIISLPKPNAGR